MGGWRAKREAILDTDDLDHMVPSFLASSDRNPYFTRHEEIKAEEQKRFFFKFLGSARAGNKAADPQSRLEELRD